MTTTISTTLKGLHEIRATYNGETKAATFETLAVLSIGKPVKIGEITVTKQEAISMLKYFYDIEGNLV